MSFKQVTALRKSGEITAALELARRDYGIFVDHFSASALFWTLRTLCEEKVAQGATEEAATILEEMKDVFQNIDDNEGIAQRCLDRLVIQVDPESDRIFKAYSTARSGDAEEAYSVIYKIKDFSSSPDKVKNYAAWVVFYFLKGKIENISTQEFEDAIETYYSIRQPNPSLVHSQILNLATRFTGIHQDYDLIGFIRRWDVQNFRPEDNLRNPEFASGLSLRDRVIRRCFINRNVKLEDVDDAFKDCPGLSAEEIAELLSRSYSYILYKDSVEDKDIPKFFTDAQEYVNRIYGSAPVRNQYHSKILESVVWEIESDRIGWFKDFFERWGFGDSFEDNDWTKSENRDGIKMASLAERALSKYADALESVRTEEYSQQYKSLLAIAAERLSDNEGVLRRMAKIHHKEGDSDKAREITVNLIKTHTGKYYFWSDLATYLDPSDEVLITACYAKALLTCNDEKYIGKVHLNLGRNLLKRGMYREALLETEKYKKTCDENGWPVKRDYEELVAAIKPGTTAAKGNIGLYLKLEVPADEYVYSDLHKHIMVYMGKITQENKATGKKRHLFALYDNHNNRFLLNPNALGINSKTDIRTCFEVRYMVENGKNKIVSAKPTAPTEILHYQPAVVLKVTDNNNIDTVFADGRKVKIPHTRINIAGENGDNVEVALNKHSVNGETVYNCVDLRVTDKPNNFTDKFQGTLKIIRKKEKTFGFVNGIYIGGHLLEGFSDKDSVSGTAITEAGRTYAVCLRHLSEQSTD